MMPPSLTDLRCCMRISDDERREVAKRLRNGGIARNSEEAYVLLLSRVGIRPQPAWWSVPPATSSNQKSAWERYLGDVARGVRGDG